ncbi:MAG: ABC transporter permease [Synergistaceae bacterium]|jgi:oligopeptide transport system permease protein|nr:ABC transporter permease [Synergistaceae bacterium]
MGKYILKRIIAGLITLFVLITVSFFLMRAIPGGPFSPGEYKKTPPEILKRIEDSYGLNDPLHVQYFRYLKNIARGDLGVSFKRLDSSVNSLIAHGFPVSAKVGAVAVIASLTAGLTLGIVSAIRRGKLSDMAAMTFATVGVSVPVFVIAVILLYIFAYFLRILPTYGLLTWKHYVLPVACLSFTPVAYITRQTRSSMLEVMQQDYIRTARAKGVSEAGIIFKHALRNACIPVVTYLGPLVAALLTGAFVVERLFAIPGIGRDYTTSIGDRDYAVILGMTLFFGIFVILCNILVDIVHVAIDPRVKLEK